MKSLIYRLKALGLKNVGIVAYDLGFEKKNRKNFIHLAKLGYVTEFRVFNFSAYPSFWDLTLRKNKKNKGEYAWKVGMIAEVARDYPGKILVWMDAGNVGSEKYFTHLKDWMPEFHGFISPNSPGQAKEWIHPGVYDYFNDNHTLYDELNNCNAASLAFDTKISQIIIDDWYKCALNKECIAPPGSSRKNHRQDQALITYLVARRGISCRTNRSSLGVTTHRDHLCKEYNEKYEEKNRKSLGT
ncbi:7623_t:CDS:1 [Dentiscutata erythropus]|nr:7623_t:CDS:1 [Dentiscutata erythropus]